MLAQTVKDTIQGAYRQMISAKKLTPRYGQRLMIAEIAKAFGSLPVHSGPPPIVVVEAGTGTGKTMAYTLAVLPIARELGLKVVIATATVALQEQVTQKDLPDLGSTWHATATPTDTRKIDPVRFGHFATG